MNRTFHLLLFSGALLLALFYHKEAAKQQEKHHQQADSLQYLRHQLDSCRIYSDELPR